MRRFRGVPLPMFDSRYLNFKEAAHRIGQSERWLRRHWPDLAQQGVKVYRVPKHAPKGRLIVEKGSLEAYLAACRVQVAS